MDPNRRMDPGAFKPAPTVLEKIKGGVTYSAAYVKDTAVYTTQAVKGHDWKRDAAATKEAAAKVGAAAQKGSSWLYNKSKDLLNGNAATKPSSAPPPPSRPRY